MGFGPWPILLRWRPNLWVFSATFAFCIKASRLVTFFTAPKNCIFWGASFESIKSGNFGWWKFSRFSWHPPIPFFVCLFVCWNKTRKTTLRLLFDWEGSKPPGSGHTRAEAQTTCVPKTGTYYVRVNPWLTLYKLTGWLASLDLRQGLYLSHPQPPNGVPPCFVWRIGFG